MSAKTRGLLRGGQCRKCPVTQSGGAGCLVDDVQAEGRIECRAGDRVRGGGAIVFPVVEIVSRVVIGPTLNVGPGPAGGAFRNTIFAKVNLRNATGRDHLSSIRRAFATVPLDSEGRGEPCSIMKFDEIWQDIFLS